MKKELDTRVTQELVHTLFWYDAGAGTLVWKISRATAKAGEVAGYIKKCGYRYIRVLGKDYLAHRLVWLYVNGAWPSKELDHIDRDRANNKIENLREAEHRDNMRNTKLPASGYRGVYFKNGKYAAEIGTDCGQITLGRYKSPAIAALVHAAAHKALYNLEEDSEKVEALCVEVSMIPDSLLREDLLKFKDLAKEANISFDEAVRTAIAEYLSGHHRRT